MNLIKDTSGLQNRSLNVHAMGFHKHRPYNNYSYIKIAVWIYFFLLIFEGALRKWLLPGLATPLLIVRDPVAVWILVMAFQKGLFPSNSTVAGMIGIGIIATFTAVFLGHGNLAVALFGARILVLHFPVIFVIGRVFTLEDVLKIGRTTLCISIPMAILVAFQFYSPQSSWINRGVGGDISGGGFSGADGYFRPPATFSFITGTVSFYSLCASYIFYFWVNRQGINFILLLASTIALLAVIPLSISRSLFFGVALTLIFVIVAVARDHRYRGNIIVAITGILIILTVINYSGILKTGVTVFTSRFETASQHEGGLHGVLIERFLGGMVGALNTNSQQPFFGYGQGLGTNVGSKITTGKVEFLVSEGEWGRVIGELGPLMGLLAIFLRLKLSFEIAVVSYKKLIQGNLMPWMFLSIVLLNIPQGQWAQPSILGFCVLVTGLLIASLKNKRSYH